MSARFVVVTGTDTGVGKTIVAAGLARALSRKGARVLAVKPVETGCVGDLASAVGRAEEDGVVLANATGQRDPPAALVRLRAPVAGPVAADREAVALDADELAARIERYGHAADVVIVEGAGGLLSPLSWSRDITHVAHRLNAQTLVVGADRLGTLNHVRLTVSALLATRLVPCGVVLSAPAVPDLSTGANAEALRRLLAREGLAERVATLRRVRGADEAAGALGDVAEWLG